jgi:Family of unknown function (DUF5985)
VIDFLDGASCLACAAVAMIFLRYWGLGDDRLLLLFGLAFVMLAVNRICLAVLDDDGEAGTFVYLARALAFGLILAAIVDKNRVRSSVE